MVTLEQTARPGELLTIEELDKREIEELLFEGEQFARGKQWQVTRDVFVANLFFEPSTRTRFSFEIAEKTLGLNVLNFSEQGSSVQKGESLLDTVKTFEALGANLLVIRHPRNDYFQSIRTALTIPIINAGDGSGHHPTQSLLDLLTIKQEFPSFKGLNVVICGDLRHSRVARSNANALTRFGANVMISGPKEWLYGYDYEHVNIDDVLEDVDVVMLLRIQHERHEDDMPWTKEEYHRRYGLTIKRVQRLKKDAIILHPGPVNRGVEIADELVESEHSRIFKQMKNGVAVRKAVIKRAIEKGGLL